MKEALDELIKRCADELVWESATEERDDELLAILRWLKAQRKALNAA